MLAARCIAMLWMVALAVNTVAAQPVPRIDALGDALPPGALYRLGTHRLQFAGHNDCAMAVSPDGRLIAGVENGRLAVWETDGGREIAGAAVDADDMLVLFTPDGKKVAFSNSSTTFALLELATGKLRELPTDGGVGYAAFSPDGQTLTTCRIGIVCTSPGSNICRWDVASGKLRSRRKLEAEDITLYAALSPDGNLLAQLEAAGDKEILSLRDTTTGEIRRRWPLARSGFSQLRFNTAGNLLALGARNGTVSVIDAATGDELECLKTGGMGCLGFAPDSVSVFYWAATSVGRWDWKTGKQLNEYRNVISLLACFPDGKRVAVVDASQHRVRFLDLASGKEVGKREALAARAHTASMFAFSPDGRLAAWDEGEELVLAEAATGKEIRRWPAALMPAGALAFSPDSRHLATGAGARVRLWEVSTGRELWSTRTNFAVNVLEFTPDGRHLAAGNGEGISLLNVKTGRFISTWVGRPHVVLARGVQRIASTDGTARRISIIDPASNRNLRDIDGLANSVRYFVPDASDGIPSPCTPVLPSLSPDGRLCLYPTYPTNRADDDDDRLGELVVRDLETGKQLPAVLHGATSILEHVAFSPDGALLALMRSDGTMELVSTLTGRTVRRLGKAATPMTATPVFTPDGRSVITAVGDLVQVWEVATGGELACRPGHKAQVESLTVSADGRLLVTASADHTMLVWDLANLCRADAPVAGALEALWEHLASTDAQRGRRAVEGLVAAPAQALPLLSKHLQPVAKLDAGCVARLTAALDSTDFAERQQATQALADLAEVAGPVLRQALSSQPTLEAHRRIESLLAKLDDWQLTPEALRTVRAVQVLESIRNDDARRMLAEWAGGAASARLTTEAAAALARLRTAR